MSGAVTRYADPRAYVRERYLAVFGGDELPVPVEAIANDTIYGLSAGIWTDDDLGECSGMLFPAERLIVVNASEAMSGDTATRREPFYDRARARPLDLPCA